MEKDVFELMEEFYFVKIFGIDFGKDWEIDLEIENFGG